jgi:dTDP-4-amino-4,6-dideoxygalactose transaminase
VNHAIALANGTLALELALKTLGIGPGDEVIVTPRTFIASASCASMVGAKPVFVDVDRDSQNIDPQAIRAAITPATRAIVAVHLAGWPCDMDPIMALAEEHGLKVIEDCAQSHGAVYYSRTPGPASAVESLETIRRDGVTLYPRMTGSLGHMAAFSFCQDKIMTTGGEGGMLLTNDDALRDRIMNAVVAKGAPCFSGSCSEVYLEKAFDRDGLRPARRLPVARELGQTSLMFMVHPTLAQKDMEQVAEAVRAVMAEAGR